MTSAATLGIYTVVSVRLCSTVVRKENRSEKTKKGSRQVRERKREREPDASKWAHMWTRNPCAAGGDHPSCLVLGLSCSSIGLGWIVSSTAGGIVTKTLAEK